MFSKKDRIVERKRICKIPATFANIDLIPTSGHAQEGPGGALLQDSHEARAVSMQFHQENR